MSTAEAPKFTDAEFGEETLLIIAEAIAERWQGDAPDDESLVDRIWLAQLHYMKLLVNADVNDLKEKPTAPNPVIPVTS